MNYSSGSIATFGSSVQRRRVTLIPSRYGFRKRAVRIDGWTVALRRARRSAIAVPGDGRMRYMLAIGGASADFPTTSCQRPNTSLCPATLCLPVEPRCLMPGTRRTGGS